MGETGNSTGDYKVSVDMREAGAKQTQMSAILSDKNTGNKASLGTKLKDLSSFYDNDGNLVIEAPKAITMRGNGNKTEITVSADMDLQDFTNAMEAAITKDVDEGGLGLNGSTFAFDTLSGQMIFESGRAGQTGDVNFAADENLIKALGFQITQESEAPAYKVTATQTGVQNPTTKSANTTTDTASGVIDGLDLKFALATEARHEGTVAATDAIYIKGDTDVVFTIHDTNSEFNGQNTGSISNGVTITLTAGRTYSTASISAVINSTVAVSNDTNHALNATAWNAAGNPTAFQPGSETMTNPGFTASMDGYNLVISSSVTGTSGTVSITASPLATQYLGLQTGRVTGSGGENAVITGANDLSGGVTFSPSGTDSVVQFRIFDGDFNTNRTNAAGDSMQGSSSTNLSFNSDTSISPISITQTFNNYFASNNVKIEASFTSSGKLELRSTETGEDAKVSIAGFDTYSQGQITKLGLINGQNDLGEPGEPAKYIGRTHESISTVGFELDGAVTFTVTDRYGSKAQQINVFGADGLAANNYRNLATDEKHTISKEMLASILDNGSHNLNTTDVAYRFDAGNRLEFYNEAPVIQLRVVLDTGNDGDHATRALKAFGIDFNTAAQGSGETEFNMHVTDRTLKFQIGANKSQQLGFAIVNTSAESLQLNGLDITSTRAATKALGLIDAAVNRISSERSKLGSLQNRLNSTINNLNVTSTNLQATESKIRDVDIATETLEFTRSQIMIQAGTAQEAQAKGLSQNALQLLQG